MTTRRFPPPWTVEELDACFIVKDQAGQKLAFVYFEEEPGRRSAAKSLTKDEARKDRCELCQVARATEVAATLALTAHERNRAAHSSGPKLKE